MSVVEANLYNQPEVSSHKIVVIGGVEKLIVPAIKPNEALAEIMDPERASYRMELRQKALEVHPTGMPVDIGQRAAYLAATGQEVRALFPDRSDIRLKNAQWKAIEELAKYDTRVKSGSYDYDDGLRKTLHDGIGSGFPDIRSVLDNAGIFFRDRDAVMERMYTEFPYFPDVLAAAQADRGFGDEERGSLDRLYTENRIASMYTDLSLIAQRADPRHELPVFQREYSAKLGGVIDGAGNRSEGKIDRALRHYSQLGSYSLPGI